MVTVRVTDNGGLHRLHARRRATSASILTAGEPAVTPAPHLTILTMIRFGSDERSTSRADRGPYPTERYAFEFELAPVRLERARGGVYRWEVEPEIAYGILPRTQVEVGVPIAYADVGTERRPGLAGVDLSVLHNPDVETRTLPALGIRADLRADVGTFAPENTYGSVTALATRTLRPLRMHLNAQYTLGPEPSATLPASLGRAAAELDADTAEPSRWLAGLAVDRTQPLRSVLFTGEAYARQPIVSSRDVEYRSARGCAINGARSSPWTPASAAVSPATIARGTWPSGPRTAWRR